MLLYPINVATLVDNVEAQLILYVFEHASSWNNRHIGTHDEGLRNTKALRELYNIEFTSK